MNTNKITKQTTFKQLISKYCINIAACKIVDWKDSEKATIKLSKDIVNSSFYPEIILAITYGQGPNGVHLAGSLVKYLKGVYIAQNKKSRIPVLSQVLSLNSQPTSIIPSSIFQTNIKNVLIVNDVFKSIKEIDDIIKYLKSAFGKSLEIRFCAFAFSHKVFKDLPSQYKCYSAWLLSIRGSILLPWWVVKNNKNNSIKHNCYIKNPPIDRPWGRYDEYVQNDVCSIRILTLYPNQQISLQRHEQRDELFIAIDDGLLIKIGNKLYKPKKGDKIIAKRKIYHRLGTIKNWMKPVRVIEIAFGFYSQNNDIFRKHDHYGRPSYDGSI